MKAPNTDDIPPPYAFAPKEDMEDAEEVDATDQDVQELIVLLEMT